MGNSRPTLLGVRDGSRLFAGLSAHHQIRVEDWTSFCRLALVRKLTWLLQLTLRPNHGIGFVVEALFVWQVFLVRWSEKLRRVLSTVARASQPREKALGQCRSCN